MNKRQLITRTVMACTRNAVFALVLLTISSNVLRAQMPANLDFSSGNFTNWLCYTGIADTGTAATGTAFKNAVLSGPVAGPPSRHALTSGPGADTVGGLPQAVAPGGGTYSMRIGNSNVGAQAEAVRYYLHVPAGSTRYSLLYQFAVVLENPGHASNAQPSFHVVAYDSAGGAVIPSANNLYVNANLPSVVPYLTSPVNSGVSAHTWAPNTLNLSGCGGKTIILEVMSSDCASAGHFGYGYFDVTSVVMYLAPAVSNCDLQANTVAVQGPPGYKYYQWYDQNFSTALNSPLDTTRSRTLPLPATPEYYNLVLIPLSLTGIPDTIRTNVFSPFTISATAAPSSVAPGDTVQLNTAVAGGSGNLTYQWSGDTTLSSSGISNPTANPLSSTRYVVTVTDTNGCFRRDTVLVNVRGSSLSAEPDITTGHIAGSRSIITMANAFTPGSSLNGRYRIIRIQPGYTLRSFRIYNRWGKKVFQTSNVADGWDGSFNGTTQPMGAYIYMLEAVSATGKSVTQQGSVTLIR